jgi:hypothetical protein
VNLAELSDAWMEMTIDALKLVKENRTLAEYKRISNLYKPEIGKSYFDRMRVAEWLISEGLVIISDGRLRISHRHFPDWLNEGMALGSQECWEILDEIDPQGFRISKFEYEILQRIGLEGEEHIVRELKSQIPEAQHAEIYHASKIDDSLGYDIATPGLDASHKAVFLEVKTTTRNDRKIRFYLSRNEAEVASKMTNWFLVVVIKNFELLKTLGYLNFSEIVDYLPHDTNSNGKWETVSIVLPRDKFSLGLPLQ